MKWEPLRYDFKKGKARAVDNFSIHIQKVTYHFI
jgi:hypothetical protein